MPQITACQTEPLIRVEPDRPKILMVDDKPENLIALERILHGLEVDLYRANSGNEALRLTLHHQFALGLLDIQMPEMDGYELAELLRQEEQTRSLPFIFISAIYTDHINVFKGYEKGAFSYITKPFEPEILINKVKFFVEKHQQENAVERARHELEERVKERTADLERSNRELEEFAYVATHDLRSPVLNLRCLVSIFEEDGLVNEANRALIEKVSKNVELIHETLHDLIGVVADKKSNAEPMKEVRFEEILGQLLEGMDEQISRCRAEVRSDFAAAPTIHYYPKHIRSVLQNLISNSLKHRSPDREPRIEIRTCRVDDRVSLSVADNGIGIDPRHRDKVFGLFKRLNTKVDGKGLGLFVTKSQIESFGGAIDFESQLGEGTVFTAKLVDQRGTPSC